MSQPSTQANQQTKPTALKIPWSDPSAPSPQQLDLSTTHRNTTAMKFMAILTTRECLLAQQRAQDMVWSLRIETSGWRHAPTRPRATTLRYEGYRNIVTSSGFRYRYYTIPVIRPVRYHGVVARRARFRRRLCKFISVPAPGTYRYCTTQCIVFTGKFGGIGNRKSELPVLYSVQCTVHKCSFERLVLYKFFIRQPSPATEHMRTSYSLF
jgi:hypothetical protein